MAAIKDMNLGSVRLLAKSTGKFGFPVNDKNEVQLAVQFVVRDDDPEFPGEYINWYQRLVEEKNYVFAWKGLRACGVTSDTFEDLRGIDANEVELVVKAEMWEGKKTIKVEYVNPPGGPELTIKKAASTASLKMLSAKARAAAVKTRGGNPAAADPVAAPRFTASAAQAPAAPPPPVDDVPPDDDREYEEPAEQAPAAPPF